MRPRLVLGRAARFCHLGVALGAVNALEALVALYGGTDKGSHGYLRHYRRRLGRRRLDRNVVFEIGVGGYESVAAGGSLAVWRDYFLRSQIVGLDVHPKRLTWGPRVHFVRADQSDDDQVQVAIERHGRPDIVIDDGSHVGAHVVATFRHLWPQVRPGGVYVIEDLATSYLAEFGGAVPAPAVSGVGLIDDLVNDVQAGDPVAGHAGAGARRDGNADVAAVHVYPGIVFVEKAGGDARLDAGRLIRSVPGARAVGRRVLPSRRRDRAQWRRLDRAVDFDVVQTGPFAGMRLNDVTTGSHIPKRLGAYESELHPLIEQWPDYEVVIDIGCGEGWYVVGLARRMPQARVWGFDVSAQARQACTEAARLNGVEVEVGGEATPAGLQRLLDGVGPALVIVDVEGAELDLLRPELTPALSRADVLVETHDFARPGVTPEILRRFAGRDAMVIEQAPRKPADYPQLDRLDPPDRHRALDESRHPDQRWLWLPANRPRTGPAQFGSAHGHD